MDLTQLTDSTTDRRSLAPGGMAAAARSVVVPTPATAASAVDIADGGDDSRDWIYGTGGCECCGSYGNMHLICGSRASHFPFQLFVGPDWPCVGFTLALIGVMTYVWLIGVAAKLHMAVFVVGCMSAGVTGGAYLYCACSDPGIVFKTRKNDPVRQKNCPSNCKVKCAQCQVWRPMGATHCYDCDACVHELDHHCPWTGKCIGRRTITLFYVFNSTLCIHVLLVAFTTVAYFVSD